jgi:hypothetical protein
MLTWRRDERREAGCKLIASLCIGTKKFYETDKWAVGQLNIIRVG